MIHGNHGSSVQDLNDLLHKAPREFVRELQNLVAYDLYHLAVMEFVTTTFICVEGLAAILAEDKIAQCICIRTPQVLESVDILPDNCERYLRNF